MRGRWGGDRVFGCKASPPEPVPRREPGNEGSGYENQARLRGLYYLPPIAQIILP
ncbi:MAG: hypothetical protein EBE86_032340 [Hormoscilla sp. GUM202]|nr:hypothetical protein [Hormoscilla sp. GUM202]